MGFWIEVFTSSKSKISKVVYRFYDKIYKSGPEMQVSKLLKKTCLLLYDIH